MRSSVKNKIIWTIALPIIFGNLAQTLFALTDTAFLGRDQCCRFGSFDDGRYLLLYLFDFSLGIAIGIQIIVARRLGEGRLDRIGVNFRSTGCFRAFSVYRSVSDSTLFHQRYSGQDHPVA